MKKHWPILVVDDEEVMCESMAAWLREDGYRVDTAPDGQKALELARAVDYAICFVDLKMPGVDGFETCARLRAGGVWTPVLLLTARDAVDDRIHGLDSGADDYLIKPFSLAELRARLRAIARRGAVERPAVLEVGDLKLDPATQRVWRGDVEIELSAKELALLELFMRRPGQVLSRYELLEQGWDINYDNRSNVVTVHVNHLRDKIDRPFNCGSIETVRGSGYRLRGIL